MPRGEGVRSRLLNTPLPNSPLGQAVGHQGTWWQLLPHLSLHLYTVNLEPEDWMRLQSKGLHFADQNNLCSEMLLSWPKVTQQGWDENMDKLDTGFFYTLHVAWITFYTLPSYNRGKVVRSASLLLRLQMTWILCAGISVGDVCVEPAT